MTPPDRPQPALDVAAIERIRREINIWGKFTDGIDWSVVHQVLNSHDALLATVQAQGERIAELESALRTHLAMSPNDPLLLTPLEQRLAALEAEREQFEGLWKKAAMGVLDLQYRLATARTALEHLTKAIDWFLEKAAFTPPWESAGQVWLEMGQRLDCANKEAKHALTDAGGLTHERAGRAAV